MIYEDMDLDLEPSHEPSPSPGDDAFSRDELENLWPLLVPSERIEGLMSLPRDQAEDFFFSLSSDDQAQLILTLPQAERRSWFRVLAPDDAADVLQSQSLDHKERDTLLGLLDEPTRKEVTGLLAYAEDDAGGLMSPRYARVRPDMSVDEAISYLRKQARAHLETIYYVFVCDDQQHLLGVISFRELFIAKPETVVRSIMRTELVKATEFMDQEAVSRLFTQSGLIAIPVVDAENRLKGIVTVDDIVDVVQEEATEDMQKMGGTEALDAPYLTISLWRMIKKRGGWLAALFLGEMLTATAMSSFQDEIAKATLVALFVPLIISSGGNSGSQATTLVIRAMALGEVSLRHWWRVVRRELLSGLALGTFLGAIGFCRIMAWQAIWHTYGAYPHLVGATIFFSLIGVVTFGTLAGSMLPFILRTLKLDPASASAPFVATLVDVTGLVIYFEVAGFILRGTLL